MRRGLADHGEDFGFGLEGSRNQRGFWTEEGHDIAQVPSGGKNYRGHRWELGEQGGSNCTVPAGDDGLDQGRGVGDDQKWTCLVVQWLRLCTFNAEGIGSIPGQGTKIPHVTWCGQKINFFKKEEMDSRISSPEYQEGRAKALPLGTHCQVRAGGRDKTHQSQDFWGLKVTKRGLPWWSSG